MLDYKMTFGERVFDAVKIVVLVLLGILTLYPFYYFIVLSFNDGMDAMKGGVYFWPRVFTLANYQRVFESPNIVSAFQVSVFTTVAGTFMSVMLTACAAFAFTKRDLPGRSLIVFMFYFATLFGGGLIPYYILLKNIHLLNNIWIYILPGLYSFYNIVIMRTFFDGIPESIAESARIDGCNDMIIFFKIYLPLSLPIIATISLFAGVGIWNDWFTGTFYISDSTLKNAAAVLQAILTEVNFQFNEQNQNIIGINQMTRQMSAVTPESLRLTFVVVIVLPIVMVYPFLQKYFIKGILVGSIK